MSSEIHPLLGINFKFNNQIAGSDTTGNALQMTVKQLVNGVFCSNTTNLDSSLFYKDKRNLVVNIMSYVFKLVFPSYPLQYIWKNSNTLIIINTEYRTSTIINLEPISTIYLHHFLAYVTQEIAKIYIYKSLPCY